jgi:hypothetical protein
MQKGTTLKLINDTLKPFEMINTKELNHQSFIFKYIKDENKKVTQQAEKFLHLIFENGILRQFK